MLWGIKRKDLQLDGIHQIGSGIVEQFNDKKFYSKFLCEESLAYIEDEKNRKKYFSYTYFIMVFSALPCVLSAFVGLNLQHTFSLIIFFIMFGSYIASFRKLVLLSRIDKQYNVFKQRKYIWIFYGGFFFISLVFWLICGFATKFIGYPDGSFLVKINPVYFFFGFVPLEIGYMIFCYYAFIQCFAKYYIIKNEY
ncbi:MAG: hypothetical protein HUJ61_01310 [Bacilli bacterium]|nr:hypothetical protein [Bacilli bacterium]